MRATSQTRQTKILLPDYFGDMLGNDGAVGEADVVGAIEEPPVLAPRRERKKLLAHVGETLVGLGAQCLGNLRAMPAARHSQPLAARGFGKPGGIGFLGRKWT